MIVSGVLWAPISIAQVTNLRETVEMNFGNIIADPNGDTIRIRPNGRVTSSGQSFFSGTSVGGKFKARGDANAAVNISFSSKNTLTGPGAAMSLKRFQHNKRTTPSFNSNGRITIKVGARLVVNPGQISGAYSGTYTIFVDYP